MFIKVKKFIISIQKLRVRGTIVLTNYKQKCENFVKEWIKTNTRYELNDIVLDDYKDFVADFSVEVINQFSVECSKTTRKGSVTSGDEMYYKKSEYQSAIQKHNYKRI